MPVTNYLWDDDNIVLEYDDEGATMAEYTYEPQQYGNLISERRDGVTYLHHYDALGSTRMLTDEDGQITDTFEYDAWGNELSRTGTTETPFRWVGEVGYYFDVEIARYYVRARAYGPLVGRWKSLESFEMASATNRYVYIGNAPTLLIDASGLQARRPRRRPPATQLPCGPNQQRCLKDAIDRILRDIERAEMAAIDCFNSDTKNPDERECRSQLLDCLKKTLNAASFKCEDRTKGDCRGRAAGGYSQGACAETKDRAKRQRDAMCTPQHVLIPNPINPTFPLTCLTVADPECGPCDDILIQSHRITLCVGGVAQDAGLPPESDNTLRVCANGRYFYRLRTLLVHEALHACVGGHGQRPNEKGQKRGNDPCDRPDAGPLSLDFMQKCSTL